MVRAANLTANSNTVMESTLEFLFVIVIVSVALASAVVVLVFVVIPIYVASRCCTRKSGSYGSARVPHVEDEDSEYYDVPRVGSGRRKGTSTKYLVSDDEPRVGSGRHRTSTQSLVSADEDAYVIPNEVEY